MYCKVAAGQESGEATKIGPVRDLPGLQLALSEPEQKKRREGGPGCESTETAEEIMERAHKQYPRGQKLGVAKELAKVKEEYIQDIQKFIRQKSTHSRLLAAQSCTIDNLSRRLKAAEGVYNDTVRYYSSHGPPPDRPLLFLLLDKIVELDTTKERVKRAEQDYTASIFTSSPIPKSSSERAPKRSKKQSKGVPSASKKIPVLKTTPSSSQPEPHEDDQVPDSSEKEQHGHDNESH